MSGNTSEGPSGRPIDISAAGGSSGLHHRHPHASNGDNGTDHPASADAKVAFDVEGGAPPGGAGAAPGKDADAGAEAAADAPSIVERVTYVDIAKQFSLLGWTASGGPAAHIGIMQRVRGLDWARTASEVRPR